MKRQRPLAIELELRGWILQKHLINRRARGRRHRLLIQIDPTYTQIYPGQPADVEEIIALVQERLPEAFITEISPDRHALWVGIETRANEPLTLRVSRYHRAT